MEAMTGLILILLSSVGARNIPAHTDQPSAWPLVLDGQSSYMKTPLATIFPAKELVQSVDYVADIELLLNKNNEVFEKIEHPVNNIMDLDNEIIENMDIHESASYKEEKISKPNKKVEADGVVRPVEVIEGREKQKGNEALFGFRTALKAGCPEGTVRVGDECMLVDKGD